MRRFITSLSAFTLILGILLFLSVFILPDRHICNSMLGQQRLKLDRLASLEGQRIVFVGGSNVGHGFDSRMVEEALHRPVVNMGLHAGLGLIYQLVSIKGLIRKDDFVVVIPEYEQFESDCWGDDELLAVVTAVVPEHQRLLSVEHWGKLALKVPRYGARKLLRFNTLFEAPKANSKYNAYGDYDGWRSTTARLPFPSATAQKSPDRFTGEVLPYLSAFVDSCESKGAKVCLLPPVHEMTTFQHEKLYIDRVAEALSANNTPFIADPARYAFPDNQFADTSYHLNSLGVTNRMNFIIKDLSSHP